MMEKRGVVDANTPQEKPAKPAAGEPTTKEAADKLAAHPTQRLVDTAVEATKKNQGKK